MLPKKIGRTSELLGLDEDSTIAILRHFDWDDTKVQEQWFENSEKLKVKIGLIYDESLTVKYPEIVERLAANNKNTCNVMYMEFDPNDEEMRPDECVCGH